MSIAGVIAEVTLIGKIERTVSQKAEQQFFGALTLLAQPIGEANLTVWRLIIAVCQLAEMLVRVIKLVSLRLWQIGAFKMRV